MAREQGVRPGDTHPEIAQAQLLGRLLRRNAGTRFGREHGFTTIGTSAEYARRLPIRDYEGFRPYVARIVAGEPRALTDEAPFMFTTTSGTTGEPKLIPVTRPWREEMVALMDPEPVTRNLQNGRYGVRRRAMSTCVRMKLRSTITA